jgi:thioredoxin 1
MFTLGSPVQRLATQDDVEALMSAQGGAALLDFWSPTCGPCQVMGPLLEAVAKQFEGQPIRFCHINTVESPEILTAFRIQAVPTMLFVLNGEIVDLVVGKLDGPGLVSKVEELMSRARGEGFWHRLFGIKKKS